jgi:zinc protease
MASPPRVRVKRSAFVTLQKLLPILYLRGGYVKGLSFVLLGMLSLSLASGATAKASQTKVIGKDFAAKTKVPWASHITSNGLEVVTLESHKVPLVTIVIAAKAGGLTETPETNGLTHLWEHMFFKGNKRIPNQEAFNRRIRQLGIVYNGDTSAEKVRYYFTLPSAFLSEGLQFMADAISTPLLAQEELEKERRVVLDEYDRSAANPGFDLRNLTRVLIYGNKDYLRDPLGHRGIIEKATRKQLFEIKNKAFVPKNSALFVAGSFDPKEVISLVDKHFSPWQNPKGWQSKVDSNFPPFPKTQNLIMARKDVRNATVTITFQGPTVRVDPKDTYAADVLINLLEHRSGKFYKKFIDSGDTFEAGLGYHTQAQAGLLQLYAATKPETATKTIENLINEVSHWSKADYFSKEQFADVYRNLAINHKRALNKSSEFIKGLAFWWSVTGLPYYADYIQNMQAITVKDVGAFVKKWLVNKPFLSSTLVSPEDANRVGLKDNTDKLIKNLLIPYRNAGSQVKG